MSIEQTLAERGNRYGQFIDNATIAQNLKMVMWGTPGWQRLAPDQKEALEVIGSKIARMLNGDPHYADSWHDIAGYATLVEKRLAGMLPVEDAPAPQPEQASDPDFWDKLFAPAPHPGESYEEYSARTWENLLVPGADEPQSQIVEKRSALRKVIDDFWRTRAVEEKS